MRSVNLLRRSRTLIPLLRQPHQRPPTSVSQTPIATTATTTVARAQSSALLAPSVFQLFLEKYNIALNARPLFVKASAASVIFFASDSATQRILEPEKEWDLARAGSGAVFGIVATSWLHYWWGFLEVAVGKRLPTSTHRLSNTLTKVFLDQAIGAPVYIYSYFFITNFLQDWNATAKKTLSEAKQLFHKTCDKATEMLPPTMLRHWTLWPAIHTFNFYYMPLHHRVLVQNLVLVGWSGYLSHLNNGGLMTPVEEVHVAEEVIRRNTLRQAVQQ